MRTNFYVDGFNLYYGSLKGTPFRWLDLERMCQILFPKADIHLIRYFTAKVQRSDWDTSAPMRQEYYWRALRTLKKVKLHEGHFSSWPTVLPQFPLAFGNESRRPLQVQVLRFEEKGSDVNLGAFLLRDCFLHECDEAVIISNDSDLATPIMMVANTCQIPITVVNPHDRQSFSRYLRKASTSCVEEINRSVLTQSQFPLDLCDHKGTFSKPNSW